MVRTVWKYPLPLVQFLMLELPAGAKILKVAQQGKGVFLWALGDPEAPVERVHLRVVSAGTEIVEDDAEHVESFSLPGSGFVFHVFRLPKVKE